MAELIQFPNLRKLFLPDKGYVYCDTDLTGADAQVVAWEANETSLKKAFKDGLDVHNFNGQRVWGAAYNPGTRRRKLVWRDECKRGVHGTNYLGGIKGLARILGWTLPEVRSFQSVWFRLNPGILGWHRRIEHDVQTTRQVRNQFGYRITFFDRPDNLLPEAVAWGPQSTVAAVCSRGAIRVRKSLPWVQILLQVHDSLTFQIPRHRFSIPNLETIRRHLEVEVPYPNDPLIIPWGLAYSEQSWGHVKKSKWEEATL